MTEHSGPIIGERDGWRVQWCAACGFAHLEKLPDEAALSHFYESEFWQTTKAGALDKIESQAAWWKAIYGDWLDRLAELAPNPYPSPRRLIDVGSGYGHFMAQAYAAGWLIQGVEPNQDAAEQSIKPVFAGTWQHVAFTYKAQAVAALWLIEHLPEPLEFLAWCREQLVPGGVLLAVVPNDFSVVQLSANESVKRPYWWIDPTHLNYFTPATFGNLLGRAGFHLVEQLTLFQMEWFLTRGHDYTADGELGARLHKQVEAFDLKMERAERLELYRKLARVGRGRELVVIARRA